MELFMVVINFLAQLAIYSKRTVWAEAGAGAVPTEGRPEGRRRGTQGEIPGLCCRDAAGYPGGRRHPWDVCVRGRAAGNLRFFCAEGKRGVPGNHGHAVGYNRLLPDREPDTGRAL